MTIIFGVPWMLLGQRATADATVTAWGLNEAVNLLNSMETKNILYLSPYK